MYAASNRFALGETAACDPFGNQGLDPSDPGFDPSLAFDPSTGCYVSGGGGGGGGGSGIPMQTPTVVTTPGNTGANAPPPDVRPLYGPTSVSPVVVPTTAPPPASTNPFVVLALLGVAGYATATLLQPKGRR